MTTKLGPDVEILPPERPSDRPSFSMAGGEREWSAGWTAPRKDQKHPHTGRRSRWSLRVLTFSIVAAAAAFVGWQVSYGYPAREALAGLSPGLRWLTVEDAAPEADPEQNGRIEQITRSVDRLSAELAANEARITHLAAGQDRITHEILRLRVLVQAASAAAHRTQRHAVYYRY